jgi:hypothetical protein
VLLISFRYWRQFIVYIKKTLFKSFTQWEINVLLKYFYCAKKYDMLSKMLDLLCRKVRYLLISLYWYVTPTHHTTVCNPNSYEKCLIWSIFYQYDWNFIWETILAYELLDKEYPEVFSLSFNLNHHIWCTLEPEI